MTPSDSPLRRTLAAPTVDSVPLSALYPLTRRLADVAGWISRGKRNSEIGMILNLSERTVEKHVHRIFEILGLETRGAAAAWWSTWALLGLPFFRNA